MKARSLCEKRTQERETTWLIRSLRKVEIADDAWMEDPDPLGLRGSFRGFKEEVRRGENSE